jgi:HemK-related putative methylase
MLPLDSLLIKACARSLYQMHSTRRLAYFKLFLKRQPVRASKFQNCDLEPLLRVGIIKRSGRMLEPVRRVFPLFGRFIVTDYYTPRNPDNVLPITFDESAYLAKKLELESGETMLDMFTGSGIYPIFAAAKAKNAVGVDLNPKAINYSKFNAILNGVEDKTEFLHGDLFQPVRGRRFNLITANPPYVVVPPIKTRTDAMHADSGVDGLDLPERFIDEIDDFLEGNGRIQMITGSVGSVLEPEIGFVKEHYRKKNKEIEIDYLHEHRIKLKTFLKRKFANTTTYYHKVISPAVLNDWHDYLKGQGYTDYYFYLLTIRPSDRYQVTSQRHQFQVRKDYYLTTDLSEFSLGYIVRLFNDYLRYLRH